MDKSKYIFVLTAFFVTTINTSGQIPFFEKPKPAIMPTYGDFNNHHPNTQQINPNTRSNEHPDAYVRDIQEFQRRQELQRQKINEELSAYYSQNTIKYDLPSNLGKPGTEHFKNALETLCNMLTGKLPLSIKDAVFTVENAYFNNSLDYSKFNEKINNLIEIAYLKTIQDGYNWKDNQTKNIMLFRVMADTFEVKVPRKESSVVSYPMLYDFEDVWGTTDISKVFVSKLLATHTGQCQSLPMLYVILCEETGAEANIAYSPSHSYAKFKDNLGNWYNVELTNGHILTDAHMVGSGFVTAEAIRNKTYLYAQTKVQTVARCLADLAYNYTVKYGYDNFVKQCTDSALKYDNNNLGALQVKANYETQRFEYVVNQVGRLHPNILKVKYPAVYRLLEERDITYAKIDASGYREMPKEAYEFWIKSVNEEKEKHKDQQPNIMLQSIR